MRNPGSFPALRHALRYILLGCWLIACACPASAQSFRFILRAEPEVIPANGVSTTSIFVQVQNTGDFNLSPSSVVRFVTTRGVIESQAQLVGGIARVRLRSTSTPGRALVTAIIGNAREEVLVDFSGDIGEVARYLEIAGPYVDYNSERGLVSASGLAALDFGDLHIQGDVRMVVDLLSERIWVEGTNGGVLIRRGKGPRAPTLRGDRLFYNLRQMQGVMRRAESVDGPLREEFEGYNLAPMEPAQNSSQASVSPSTAAPANSVASNEENAPSTLGIDGAAARLSLERSLAGRDGFALQQDAVGDALPLLREDAPASPQPISDSASIRFDRRRADDGIQHASIWLAATDKADPLSAHLFSVDRKEKATETSRSDEALDAESTLARDGGDLPEVTPDTPSGLPGLSTTPPTILDAAPDSTSQPIKPIEPAQLQAQLLSEPPWPELVRDRGYWITARRIRVFPQERIQFERSTIFFNGSKLFSMPLYVLSLGGITNPVAGMVGFNSSGGLRLNIPFYYMASPRGTGAVYLQHAPGNGFAAENPGFALAVDQQYFLSRNSHGRFNIDQIGRGSWNFNWQHNLQLSPTLTSRVYVNAPRHRDLYTYATVVKDFSTVQLGLEGSYGRPESGDNSALGQVFARLRPRQLGASGWSYTVSANALARRYNRFTQGPGGGGGIGLPGQARPGTPQAVPTTLLGQTLNVALQSPEYRPWKGSHLNATLLGTAYNYSDGRRGIAPGVLLGWRQTLGRNASLQLDYNYDKGGAGLYSADFAHYISGGVSLLIGNKIAANAFLSHSLNNGTLYGTAGLDYYFKPKWRIGLFSDYSSFTGNDDLLNYGFSLGRIIGQREVTLNWDHDRGRFYVELGGFRL